MNNIISCKICGKKLKGKQTLYCSLTCKNNAHQSYDAQKLRGIKRKIELVKLLGGQCSICGYKKNSSALTFHHKDPNKKEFKLDIRSLSNRKLPKIQKEIEKCALLCHNCHAEIHFPQHDLESISLSRLL